MSLYLVEVISCLSAELRHLNVLKIIFAVYRDCDFDAMAKYVMLRIDFELGGYVSTHPRF